MGYKALVGILISSFKVNLFGVDLKEVRKIADNLQKLNIKSPDSAKKMAQNFCKGLNKNPDYYSEIKQVISMKVPGDDHELFSAIEEIIKIAEQ